MTDPDPPSTAEAHLAMPLSYLLFLLTDLGRGLAEAEPAAPNGIREGGTVWGFQAAEPGPPSL
jgi:hypothetical protein